MLASIKDALETVSKTPNSLILLTFPWWHLLRRYNTQKKSLTIVGDFFCGCIQATGLVWHHAPACMELPKAYGITKGVFPCSLIPYNALH